MGCCDDDGCEDEGHSTTAVLDVDGDGDDDDDGDEVDDDDIFVVVDEVWMTSICDRGFP